MDTSNQTTWKSPANIALVKYWGKYGDQLPRNPSISMTLRRSVSLTEVSWTRTQGKPAHSFLFEGKSEPRFEKKVFDFISRTSGQLPYIGNCSLNIASSNNFPHSSGISSSASFMSSLAACLIRAEEKISGTKLSESDFYRKVSSLARLGSGSASRSVYGGFTLWGRSEAIADSSDEYAVPVNHLVHPVFKTYRDAVLVVSSSPKSLSSSAGHQLMESNPYAAQRFNRARENTGRMIGILGTGDQQAFNRLVEEEAMTLHGLIQSSAGSPILMEPGTLSIIRLLREYRQQTDSNLCFTLDAGPNVHLLYPENEELQVKKFISDALLPFCENGRWIDDLAGNGCEELTTD